MASPELRYLLSLWGTIGSKSGLWGEIPVILARDAQESERQTQAGRSAGERVWQWR